MSFTKEEIEKTVNKVFKKYDKNRSGYLEKSELKNFISHYYEKIQKPEPTVGEINEIITHYDKNYDDKIHKEELYILFMEKLA